MKKILFLAILTLSFSNLFAQSELIIVNGKTKDGKRIRIDYYKGQREDVIERIDYQVVDELNAQIAELKKKIKSNTATIESLRKEKGENEATISGLRDSIAELNNSLAILQAQYQGYSADLEAARAQLSMYQSDSIVDNAALMVAIDTLTQANQRLRLQIENCNNDLQALDNELNAMRSSFSVGADFGFGLGLYSNANLDYIFWNTKTTYNQHASVYFQTKRLFKKFPLSAGIGVGYDNMALNAYSHYFSETFTNVVDADGDICDLTRTYNNLSEKVSLSYISIPVFVAFGQPYANKISAYGKLTIMPMINIAKSIDASGTYTASGHYNTWNVTFYDIPELGLNTNEPCYAEDMEVNVNSFILAGSLSAGVYIPLCNLNKAGNSSRFVLKGGVRIDYTFMPIAGNGPKDIEGSIYHLGSINSIENTKMCSPIIEIGLVYLLQK